MAQGAPLYNAGSPEKCAAIYMNVMVDMVNGVYGPMPETLRSSMQNTLNHASGMHSEDQKAWALRRSLDHAYHMMSTTAGR